MNKKWLPYLLILGLAIVLFILRRCNQPVTNTVKKQTEKKSDPAASSGRGFNREVTELEYTRHASCRMECREVSKAEVEEILHGGVINYRKSNVKGHPCPTYALEGISSDNQKLRIVFAQCDTKTKVVTCIDLDRDWECACPGDKRSGSSKQSKP